MSAVMPSTNPKPRFEFARAGAFAFVVAMAASLLGAAALPAAKPVLWKSVDQALLRVDDKAIKDWNIYQTGKKLDPLLLQMGPRFLLLAVKERRIFEIPAAQIEHKGDDVFFDPSARPDKPIETSDWMIRDVGLAYRIGVTLSADKRVLDLQFPHPLDIRSIY